MVGVAGLPLLQVAGCPAGVDPLALTISLASNFANLASQQLIAGFAGQFSQFLLQSFPGSDILRALLGGNAGIFP
jgi:hypothetical protein